jgi:hypothetical protein
MLRIDKGVSGVVQVQRLSLAEAGLAERTDIQRLIWRHPAEFFDEIGETLLLIGQEVRPSDMVSDRIDLLAIDEQGAAVIVELKRGKDRLQLLQAASYAGMVGRWTPPRFAQVLAGARGIPQADADAQIEGFLEGDVSALNTKQRLILVAEGFDTALLAAAEWLVERHGVDLTCCRLEVMRDRDADYLSVSQVYPPPRAEPSARGGPPDWEAALAAVRNASLAAFVRSEISRPNRKSSPQARNIRFWRDGRRMFWLGVKADFASVVQVGRFDGDLTFWRERVSEPDRVKERSSGSRVTFRLRSPEDFERFRTAFDAELHGVAFVAAAAAEDEPDDDEEDVADREAST